MPTDSSYNEKELLQQVAQGDEKAFRQAYDHYWNRVYTMGLIYFKSPVLAQDMAQEVFLTLWVKRAELPALNNFSAWLHVLIRNRIISTLRKKMVLYTLDDEAGDNLPENSFIPEQELLRKETEELIHKAIAQLPPQQRKIYLLSREEGLKLTQIAALLHLSHNTIREHMSKALKSIRVFLIRYMDLWGLLALAFLKIFHL